MAIRRINTVCPRNCYSTCSFRVQVEDGRITGYSTQPANRATPEGMCLKGQSYIERVYARDRILYPLRKETSGTFKRISWPEALREIAGKMMLYKKQYGPHSIFFYSSSGSSGVVNDFSLAFWRLFGGATVSYGNLCWPAGLEATRMTLGDNRHNVPWDLENARLILLWGKNAAETNVHEMIFIRKAQEQGARLVVIDPRRTPTAEKADLLIQPKPGTDGALALGIARFLIKKDMVDHDFIRDHVKGYDSFTRSLGSYDMDTVSRITGVPVSYIEKLAGMIGGIQPMTLIPGYGMQRYTNGGQTIRCLLSLSVITGNIGKPGACWHYANLQSYVFDKVKEPLSYYPEGNHSLFRQTVSKARLGIDLLQQKDPEIKMIWVERGNPVTQNPDTNSNLKAFEKADFRVVVEQFMTDTAREADIILPAKSLFEQADLVGSYWNPYIQLKQKVIEPPEEIKPETEIYYLLAKELGYSDKELEGILPRNNEALENWLKERIKSYPELSWDQLIEGPVIAPGIQEIAFSDKHFPTASGKIELYSDEIARRWGVDPLPSFTLPKEIPGKSRYPLYLLTPNTKNRIHSQFGNLDIIRQLDPGPVAEINPEDAAKRGIREGDTIRIYNDRGELRVKCRYNYGQIPGCVVIPNGYWISEGGGVNFLSAPRETDMGHGTAFHDNLVEIEHIS